MDMKHEYTIEIIYHFTCGYCKGWWSRALTPTVNKNKEFKIDSPNRLSFCPHCGEDGDVEIKDKFLNEN